MPVSKIRILLADDDHVFLKLTKALLSKEGYEVICADNVEAADELLHQDHFDIMMLDMCFPALHDGFGMLRKIVFVDYILLDHHVLAIQLSLMHLSKR